MADKKGATFPINLGGNASAFAKEAAVSVDQLRDSLDTSKKAVAGYSEALRNLKGNSSEVAAAQAQLKAKIAAENGAITQSTLKLVQQGKSVRASTKEKKDAAAATKTATSALKENSSVLDKFIGSISEATTGESLLAAGAAGAAAGVLALGAALVAGTIAFTKWIFESRNAARNMQLAREAWVGTTANATALGSQIDLLATKLPLAKNELNDIAVSLAQTRLSGDELVDTLNTLGQARSALGAGAESKLRELVERGGQTQRFAVNPLELQGAGVDFKDIAGALAKNLNVGIDEAQNALVNGRVKLEDGAKALRDAVEKKVGNINLRKLASLEGLTQKVGESFQGLTRDVNIDPVLTDLKELFGLISDDSASGRAIRQLVTTIGTGLVGALHDAVPTAKTLFQTLVLSTLKLEKRYYELKIATKQAIAGSTFLQYGLKLAKVIGEADISFFGFSNQIRGTISVLDTMSTILSAIIDGVKTLSTELDKVSPTAQLKSLGSAAGGSFGSGVLEGIRSSAGGVADAVGGLATGIKDTFAGGGPGLEIHSPSKVGDRFGQAFSEGIAQGMERGQDGVNAASGDLALAVPPKGNAGGGAGGGAGQVTIGPITIQIAVDSEASAAAVMGMSPAFRVQFRKLLEEVLMSQGVPVHT